MRRVDSSDIFDITPILTDTKNLTLLKFLYTVLLCYMPPNMPPNILSNILRYYRCYHSIDFIIRGCEIVFVSITRLIYLMYSN